MSDFTQDSFFKIIYICDDPDLCNPKYALIFVSFLQSTRIVRCPQAKNQASLYILNSFTLFKMQRIALALDYSNSTSRLIFL